MGIFAEAIRNGIQAAASRKLVLKEVESMFNELADDIRSVYPEATVSVKTENDSLVQLFVGDARNPFDGFLLVDVKGPYDFHMKFFCDRGFCPVNNVESMQNIICDVMRGAHIARRIQPGNESQK